MTIKIRNLSLPAALFAAAALLGFGALPAEAYFLSMEQKGQLLSDGIIGDTAGNRYNVRIVPGYSASGDLAEKFWRAGYAHEKQGVAHVGKGFVDIGDGLADVPMSARRLGAYASSSPYKGIAEGVEQGWDAQTYLYGEFLGSELGGAWAEYWSNARRAHERRSFGWWFAYPWATGKGMVNTTLRATVGLTGSALAAAYGLALRPAYEVAKPASLMVYDIGVGGYKMGKGTGRIAWGMGHVAYGAGVEQVGGGVVLPVVAAGWTTAVGMPMALVGREPTPRSVDGWWVTMLFDSPDFAGGAAERFDEATLARALAYEGASMRAFAERAALFAERDSVVAALEREILRAREEYAMRAHARHRELLEGAPRPEGPWKQGLDDAEREFVRERAAAAIEASSLYAAWSEEDKESLLDRVSGNWGRNILPGPTASPRPNPASKTGPHTIFREEARQVFGEGAGK